MTDAMRLAEVVDKAIARLTTQSLRTCLNCRNAQVTHVDGVMGPMVLCSKGHWPSSYRLGTVLMGKKGAMKHKGQCPDWTE